MPAPLGVSKYERAYYELTNSESELMKEKLRFETLFNQFLIRYRPYSSAGKTLAEPLFDKRRIMDLLN
jgi:hypothetical protein